MRVFSYIVRHDGGYAPNPFHGVCTLACCKPKIRSSAKRGDLILGLTGKGKGYRLVYGMLVIDRMSFADYWHKYQAKRPDMAAPDRFRRSGDNNYEPMPDGSYRQIPCQHSLKPSLAEDPESKRHDLGADGSNPVLIGGRFCYFGANAERLPPNLGFLIAGRGHRCNFTPEQVATALTWFEGLPTGVRGRPSLWPEDDLSWEQGAPLPVGAPTAPTPPGRSLGCRR